jgi:DNA-binding response OmpR family regulator
MTGSSERPATGRRLGRTIRAMGAGGAPEQDGSDTELHQASERRVEYRVLGPVEVTEHGSPVAVGGPKERTLLAVLLARVNAVVSVDAVVDALWSGRPPRTAERTVAAYVARLRAVVEPERPKGRRRPC